MRVEIGGEILAALWPREPREPRERGGQASRPAQVSHVSHVSGGSGEPARPGEPREPRELGGGMSKKADEVSLRPGEPAVESFT